VSTLLETTSAIPAITVLCLLCAQTFKLFTPLSNKHLPVLCGVCGLALGVACFFFFPDYIPSQNIVAAAAKGIVSGWAATGANQVVKQYTGE